MSFPKISLLFFIVILVGCASPQLGPPLLGSRRPPPPAFERGAANRVPANTTAPRPTQIQPIECPIDNFINVSPYQQTQGYPNPELRVYCTDQHLVVESNGIPNFEFSQITPNDLSAQTYRWRIPLKPQLAATPSALPLLGPVAVAVNGIPIFGPNEAAPQGYGDPYLDQILDYCNGHTAPRGMYHFHARPDCLFEDLEGNVSLVIAYALDGYPILAPYICADAVCSQSKAVHSSWQRTQNVTAAWEAHEYVAGSGDLDECNGLTLADGSYVYFATDTFPYFLGCYRGLVDVDTSGFGPPPGGPDQENNQSRPLRRHPDLAAAAEQLGVSEQILRNALGPPPPDLRATARQLGVTEQALFDVLGVPPGDGSPPPRRGG